MDGRDLFRLIFWTWLAISTYILIRRYMRRHDAGSDDEMRPGDGAISAEMSRALTPEPAPARTPQPSTPTDPGTTGSTAPPAHSIFDPAPTPEPRTRPLAELVKGIALPCDLAPLAGHTSRPGARESAVFITAGFDSGEVGRSLGEALRVLGYDLEPLDETEALASRGDDRLKIAVHPDPPSVQRHGSPAFPTATSADTVAELWTD